METQEAAVKRYLRDVRKAMSKEARRDKLFFQGCSNFVIEFVDEDGRNFTYERLVITLGSPATVAANYELLMQDKIQSLRQAYRKKVRLVNSFFAILLLLCLMYLAFVWMDIFLMAPNGYSVTTINAVSY